MIRSISTLTAALLLSAPAILTAQATDSTTKAHAAAPGAQAASLRGNLSIDGHLTEDAWAAATPVTSFTQLDPEEGKPATQKTEVRFLYDGQTLYVGARMHDTGEVSSRLARRDAYLSDSDWFRLSLDSYHDHNCQH